MEHKMICIRETLIIPFANNKGAGQPVHPQSLSSAFAVRCLDSMISLVPIFAISLLSLASVAEQAGLSLTMLKTPKTGFLMMRSNSFFLFSKLTIKLCGHQYDWKDFIYPTQSAGIYLTELQSPGLQKLFKHHSVLTHFTRSYTNTKWM